MTAPTLPHQFVPLASGYSCDDPGGVMRTDVAGGAPRYALEWDRGTQRFIVTLMLDAAAFSVWCAFYHHLIRKGSLPFNMLLDSGFGTSPHLVNIVPGSYSAARTGGNHTAVSMVVETEGQAYGMTAADAQIMLDLYTLSGDSTSLLLDLIARFATVDSLALDF